MKRVLYFALGLMGILALLSSVAASCVTNENLMKQGFLQYAQTKHLQVPASRYGDYAHALAQYLDGKTPGVKVPDPETGKETDAFSPKENLHLADVRSIVSVLKAVRWIGGGGAVAAIALLYLLKKQARPQVMHRLVAGFAAASAAVLFLAAGLFIWGCVNFRGLFWAFHQAVFSNDLWLLDPGTDLLVALMPLPFFTWYAGEIGKALLPVLGMMLLVIVAALRLRAKPASAREAAD